jgi:hypothetical protein
MINSEEYDELLEMYEEMMYRYDEMKRVIKSHSPDYERWKAGGFIIDPDIVSMYPTMLQAIESLEVVVENEDDEDMDDDDLSILEGNRWPE